MPRAGFLHRISGYPMRAIPTGTDTSGHFKHLTFDLRTMRKTFCGFSHPAENTPRRLVISHSVRPGNLLIKNGGGTRSRNYRHLTNLVYSCGAFSIIVSLPLTIFADGLSRVHPDDVSVFLMRKMFIIFSLSALLSGIYGTLLLMPWVVYSPGKAYLFPGPGLCAGMLPLATNFGIFHC